MFRTHTQWLCASSASQLHALPGVDTGDVPVASIPVCLSGGGGGGGVCVCVCVCVCGIVNVCSRTLSLSLSGW
jgi:hypothetical protein